MKIKHWILIALTAAALGAKAEPQAVCWTLDSTLVPGMVEAFADTYKYSPTIQVTDENGETSTVANPESSVQFAKKQIAKYALEVKNAYDKKKALEAVQVEVLDGSAIGI